MVSMNETKRISGTIVASSHEEAQGKLDKAAEDGSYMSLFPEEGYPEWDGFELKCIGHVDHPKQMTMLEVEGLPSGNFKN